MTGADGRLCGASSENDEERRYYCPCPGRELEFEGEQYWWSIRSSVPTPVWLQIGDDVRLT